MATVKALLSMRDDDLGEGQKKTYEEEVANLNAMLMSRSKKKEL